MATQKLHISLQVPKSKTPHRATNLKTIKISDIWWGMEDNEEFEAWRKCPDSPDVAAYKRRHSIAFYYGPVERVRDETSPSPGNSGEEDQSTPAVDEGEKEEEASKAPKKSGPRPWNHWISVSEAKIGRIRKLAALEELKAVLKKSADPTSPLTIIPEHNDDKEPGEEHVPKPQPEEPKAEPEYQLRGPKEWYCDV
ncbi:hypothetical protein BDZ45DRAFT_684166 [Acephala macrosclerotiorum]|nr:hypothetical protein BDZ45DRAFT_684166 [Acephala macrosclerotiorum]